MAPAASWSLRAETPKGGHNRDSTQKRAPAPLGRFIPICVERMRLQMRLRSLASPGRMHDLGLRIAWSEGGGGCEIRTREGLPPTRFPTMLASVHRRPPPYVSWADRDGWVSADTREPRRMRPHLRPAGPAGRCRQCGPHPAACTVPVLACA